MKNINKIALADITKTSSPIDLNGKYMWVISNVHIDATRNLGLISIKKYKRLAG